MPPNKVYELIIDYPLTQPYYHKLKTGSKGISYCQLMKIIYKAYIYVYKQDVKHGKYEIWGHDIDDLCLEGIRVNHKTKQITLNIGS